MVTTPIMSNAAIAASTTVSSESMLTIGIAREVA
jgi:hypothetical protein